MRVESESTRLPTSMANLRNLTSFDLTNRNFDFRQLEFVKMLPKIEKLEVYLGDGYVNGHVSTKFLLDLIEATPSLIGINETWEENKPEITYAISCNRFKSRASFGRQTENMSPILKRLWPRMLSRGMHSFISAMNKKFNRYPSRGTYTMQPQDSVFMLLKEERESFIQILLDRSNGATSNA